MTNRPAIKRTPHASYIGRFAAALSLSATIALCLVVLSSCGSGTASAEDLERAGDLEGAVLAYQEALKTAPDDVEIISALGVDLMLLGRYDEALPFQEKTVRLDADDVQTRVELGFNYLNHQGRPADAVAVLKEATALDASAKNLAFLAQAQAAAGDVRAAEGSLRASIETDSRFAHAYTLLIGLLEDTGRALEAQDVRAAAARNGVDT